MEVLLAAIELGEAAFGKTPEGFNAIDVSMGSSVHKRLAVVHTDMLVVSDIHEPVIASPLVCCHDAPGVDSAENNGAKRLSPAIWNNLRVDRSTTLKDAKDGLLVGPPAALPWDAPATLRPKVTFIEFHDSNDSFQFIAAMPVDCLTEQIEVPVHGVAIDPRQFCSFGGVNIDTEVA